MTSDAEDARREALEPLLERPWDFDLYAAVETAMAAHPDAPGIGRSTRIEDDPIRLSQRISLKFEPSPVVGARWEERGGRRVLEIRQVAFGPLGPNGPLPVHVSEDAMREARAGRPWLGAFLDVFTHRMTSLLVRAWQSGRMVSSRALGREDPYPAWIASLYGAGPAEFRDRDAFPDDLKRYAAGWLAGRRRSVAALEGVLTIAAGAPVEVREHAPEWLDMPEAEQTRLGARASRLGADAALGPRFFSVQTRVAARTAPLSYAAFAALLPGGARHAAMRDAGRMLMGLGWSWSITLRLRAEEAPRLRLDGARRLGFDTWSEGAPETGALDDVTLEGAG